MVAGFGDFMGISGINDICILVIPRFDASPKVYMSSSSGAPAPRGVKQIPRGKEDKIWQV